MVLNYETSHIAGSEDFLQQITAEEAIARLFSLTDKSLFDSLEH